MHVALFDPEWRGHHSPYAALLSEGLLEEGHRVTFFTAPNHPHLDDFPTHDDFTVVKLSDSTVESGNVVYVKKARDQWTKTKQLTEAVRRCRSEGVDVLHILCLDFMHIPVFLTDLREDNLPPIVASLHRDIPFDSNYESGDLSTKIRSVAESALMWANERAQSWSLQHRTIERQVVHANRIRNRVVERIPGVTEVNTITLPAPTPDIDDISQQAARERLDLPTDVPILLYFGELRYDKGPDLLVAAMDEVDEPVCVVFAGQEAYFDRTDLESWQADVDSPATFEARLEYIPEEEVNYYFAAADALVLPYRRKYAISGPLRRAVMAGTAVIGSDDSDVGSIIERHDLGATFERGDADDLGDVVAEFLKNTDGTTDSVRERAEQIHWKNVAKAFAETYETVTDR